MNHSRPPKPALRPFVALLWASDGAGVPPPSSGRELVLPTGSVHIVFRLHDRPLRVFKDGSDIVGESFGRAVIGGARARPYLKDVSIPGPSVGALLRPGACEMIIGAPARAFSDAHTSLADAWGRQKVAEIEERLNETGWASHRIDVLEAALEARLPRIGGTDPLVAHALSRFHASWRVGDVVHEIGYSHRHFVALFSEAVGLNPKPYCRLLRFGGVLDRLAAEPGMAWAELAVDQGYADQAHLSREFREFAGVSPGHYRRLAPRFPRHVPL